MLVLHRLIRALTMLVSRFALGAGAALLLGAGLLLGASAAWAHPHVMVTAKAQIIYGKDGKVTAIRHAWAFDETYSVYAVQGLDADKNGILTSAELAELAKVNVESLAEFGYFTIAKANGKAQPFGAPFDYELAFANNVLTLTFTLPLASPAVANRSFGLEIADPTWFVAFTLAPGDDAVVLKDAPAGCVLKLTRPKPPELAPNTNTLSEEFFTSGGGASVGLQFVNRALVACP